MLIEKALRLTPEKLKRPQVGGIDAISTLEHFAIITYAVAPESLSRHLAPRFEPVCVRLADGKLHALVSVVPFHDVDFRLARFPLIRFAFGQTNYRAYVRDRETGTHCAWFFGTTLDSGTAIFPRYLWKLPWHRGRINFSCQPEEEVYHRYYMETKSRWAAAEVELEDAGGPLDHLDGFPDLETAMVVLTHPLEGFYLRRDGVLGSYRVWHNRLTPRVGNCRKASFALLDRLGLVAFADQDRPYSVMLQRQIEFTIYLPPRKLTGKADS